MAPGAKVPARMTPSIWIKKFYRTTKIEDAFKCILYFCIIQFSLIIIPISPAAIEEVIGRVHVLLSPAMLSRLCRYIAAGRHRRRLRYLLR